jgi:nucleoside phosphorylase
VQPEATIASDVLLLAAHIVELEGLSKGLLAHGATEGVHAIGARRVACACVGVGMTAAGAGTARAIARHRPRSVVLLGSYGRYPQSALSLSPTQACVAQRVKLIDPAVAQGKAALPAPMPAELTLELSLIAELERHGASRMATLGTTLAITTDDAMAHLLGEHSACDGENLEALAVAQACVDDGIPCAVLVACTNDVGSTGRKAWLANHAEAARATGRVIEAWLRAS